MDTLRSLTKHDDVAGDWSGLRRSLASTSSSTAKPYDWRFFGALTTECIVLVIGLVGNGLLVHMFASHRALRTTANIYILSIAVTDLLVTTSCPAAMVLTDLTGGWPLGVLLCKLSQAVMEFSNCASVLALVALSMERYHAVLHPVDNFTSSHRFSIVAISAILIISALFSIPKFTYSDVIENIVLVNEEHTLVYSCVYSGEEDELVKRLALFDLFAFYVVPLCVVSAMYAAVYRRLARDAPASRRRSVHQEQMRSKVSRTVFVLTAIFFVAFLPYNMFRLKIFLGGEDYFWSSAVKYAYCFGCLHFWLNPIALYVCCDTLRKHYNRYFSCRLVVWRSQSYGNYGGSQQSDQQESAMTTISAVENG